MWQSRIVSTFAVDPDKPVGVPNEHIFEADFQRSKRARQLGPVFDALDRDTAMREALAPLVPGLGQYLKLQVRARARAKKECRGKRKCKLAHSREARGEGARERKSAGATSMFA